MKRRLKLTPVAIMANRMKPLARSHRIAQLRALIQQQPIHATRREELVALLCDEMSAPPGREVGCGRSLDAATGRARAEKPGIAVSPELADYVAKRTA
jgi:hypothetical protein